jgi:hypothetical protein
MDLNIKIPATPIEWKVPSNQPPWKDQAISIIKKYKSLYGAQFKVAAQETGIPEWLLVGFAGVEGMGGLNEKFTGASNGTPSIMQMNPTTGYQTLETELKKNTIGKMIGFYQAIPNAFILKKPIPKDFWSASNIKVRQEDAKDYLSLKPMAVVSPMIFKALSQNVGFAIRLGAFHLGQLLLTSIKEVGSPRLDHVIIKYNGGIGIYEKRVLKTDLKDVDTTNLINTYKTRHNATTPDYIVKLMGKNGFLDVQKQGLA